MYEEPELFQGIDPAIYFKDASEEKADNFSAVVAAGAFLVMGFLLVYRICRRKKTTTLVKKDKGTKKNR